jgi:hypothetical protein
MGVVKFVLVNAETGRVMADLSNLTTIPKDTAPFTIMAITNPETVGSVDFHVTSASGIYALLVLQLLLYAF